jgi:voltage-gated potassium channel
VLQRQADRAIERITRAPLRGAWTAAATITAAVTLVGGLLMRVTDPDTFPSIWSGLWWAVQTTTTVGYGDLVPESGAGRFVAALVMLGGIGFITVSTAAIASAFVEAARRRRAADDDSVAAEVREVRRQLEILTAQMQAMAGGGRPESGGDPERH